MKISVREVQTFVLNLHFSLAILINNSRLESSFIPERERGNRYPASGLAEM